MQLKNIHDVEKLFKVIDSCEGKVELVTSDGDRLNLKSKLTQYVSFAKLFGEQNIPEMEVVAYNKDDVARLFSFMVDGE